MSAIEDGPVIRTSDQRIRVFVSLFEVTEENVDPVVCICATLEGVPLDSGG